MPIFQQDLVGHHDQHSTLTRRTMLKALFGAVPLLTGATQLLASDSEGTNTREARDDALGHIPLAKMSPTAQAKAKNILDDYSIYRRLPVEMIRCDPEFYLFLVNRPDTVVSIWEVLGISDVRLRQTAANIYQADDGKGTITTIEYLHRSHDKHLVLATGKYDGPLFKKKIDGNCLAMLRTGYIKSSDGHHHVAHQLDAFIQIDSVGAEVLAKSLQRMFGKVADRNFSEVSDFVGSLARKAESDPDWVERVTSEMDKVHPKVKEDFIKVAAKVAEKHKIMRTSALKTTRAQSE